MSKKTTKRALAMSFVSVFLCVCMLVGTTFAWFTDSVSSGNNIIKSGTLDVTMEWKDATANGAQQTYKDASEGAIFNYDKWEPGYVEAKHVKISNVGNLAFKYKLNIVPTGTASELANVIDVYFVDGEQTVTRDMIAAATPIGTLADLITDPDGAAYGKLYPVGNTANEPSAQTVTIALKMQESAGNEYQELSIGSDFSVQLLAAQLEAEFDSFDNTYDKFADYDGEISTAAALVAAFTEGGTYKVLSDIIVDDYAEIPAGKTVNLDLAGKTISKSVDDGLIVRNYGALTLAGNGTIDGTIGNYAIRNEAGSSLTVEEGVVVDGGFGAISCFGGTITINGGDFSNEESNTTHYVVYATNNSTVTINGGTFTFADDQYAGANGSPILAATNGSTIEINGGTFEATGGSALCYNANNIVIKGGTFMNRAYNTYGGTIEGKVATGYKAVDNGDGTWTVAMNQTGFENAISNAADGDTLTLGSGTYTIPDSAQGKTLTIVGNGDTTVSVVDDGGSEGDIDYSFRGSNVTFENVTLNIQGSSYPGYAGLSATYNDCTIIGSNYTLYGNSVFNNCTFNLNNGYVWTWGAAEVEFNGCTFEDTVGGKAKAILVHNTVETVVTVKDCTFKATTPAQTWDGIPVAAVSIDPENGSPDAKVYFEGTNTYDSAFNSLYQVKYTSEVDDVKVYVNGVEQTLTAMKEG